MVGGVCNRGECCRGAGVVPRVAGGNGPPPCLRFFAETFTHSVPLVFGHCRASPTLVEVSIRKWILFAREPSVQQGQAEIDMVDMGSNAGLPRNRLHRGCCRRNCSKLSKK